MPSDLEHQVAEAKCPCSDNIDDEMCGYCLEWRVIGRAKGHSGWCKCGSTSLRWPGLSRECPGSIPPAYIQTGEGQIYNLGRITDHEYPKGTVSHCRTINVMKWRTKAWLEECGGGCLGIGRIPDVSLEKVFTLLISYSEYGDRVEIIKVGLEYLVFPKACSSTTMLDAACDALLASIE